MHCNPKLNPVFFTGLVLFLLVGTKVKGRKAKRVVFFGDSITQMGEEQDGYITLLRNMVEDAGDRAPAELIGAGIGGNKVYDLYLRLHEDVLENSPDVVVIYVGVNDVWHKATAGTGTDPDKFGEFYSAIIRLLRARNIRVVVCTPAVIGEKTNGANGQDDDVDAYAQIIRSIARRNKLACCDLRKAFLDYGLANNPENKASGILTTDGVHLNATGNRLVAELLLPLIR